MRGSKPWFSGEQVRKLATNVARRLEELGDPYVRIPDIEDFRTQPRDDPWQLDALAVDIEVGPVTIALFVKADPGKAREEVDIDGLAKSIAKHVLLARSDREGISALEKARTAIETKIRRDRSSLALSSVRYRAAEIRRPESLLGRTLQVQVSLIDNLLRPAVEVVTGRDVREVCRKLTPLGRSATLRSARLADLIACDAILEIDHVAEHAILAAGAHVGDVVRKLLDPKRAAAGMRACEPPWRGRDGENVSVRAVDGRIVLQLFLGKLWTDEQGDLILQGTLPATVLAAAPGRPLRDIVDHPLLLGDARIHDVDEEDGEIRIRLERRHRAVSIEEIEPRSKA